MTSEAEKAAAIYKSNDAAKGVYYSSGRVPAFLAGGKWMLEQAEKMAYPSEVDSDGERAGIERYWVKLDDLKKLVEGEG